tara:strand:- start:211 stop:564 length:354 start_codon:yes stop_codon:yes gene_type:complete
MGILNTIFGSGDVISKGMDLIDSFHTSDTEMIEVKTKAKTDLMTAYAPFKIAQRYLALMFTVTYIASYVLVIVMMFLDKDTSAVKGIISEFQIDWIMLSIVMFYFGAGFTESVMKKK